MSWQHCLDNTTTSTSAQQATALQAQQHCVWAIQELTCTLEGSAEIGSSDLLTCVGSAAVDLRALVGPGATAEMALRMPLVGRLMPALCRDAELLISVAAHDLPRLSVLVWSPRRVLRAESLCALVCHTACLLYEWVIAAVTGPEPLCMVKKKPLLYFPQVKVATRSLYSMTLTSARCRTHRRQQHACLQGHITLACTQLALCSMAEVKRA